jgi:hypothetical protein
VVDFFRGWEIFGQHTLPHFTDVNRDNLGSPADFPSNPNTLHIIITTPGTFKKSNPKEIYDVFLDVVQGAAEVYLVPDTGEAVAKAIQIGRDKGLPILGAGSFHLAGEIRRCVLKAASEPPVT